MGFITKSLCFILFITGFFAHAAGAFEAGEYFQARCLSCHSIGGGDGIGPDLKGVTERREREWVIAFIKNSQELIKSGDPQANELFQKYNNRVMSAFDVSDEEAGYIIDFIEGGDFSKLKSAIKPAMAALPYDIEKGRQLFTGELPLINGGASCISCHAAGTASPDYGGGTLGPDLVLTSYPSYGDEIFSKAISAINFPTMIPVYKGKKITDDENYYLRSFFHNQSLRYISDPKLVKKQTDPKTRFLFFGFLASGVFILALDIGWKNRRKKTRRPY